MDNSVFDAEAVKFNHQMSVQIRFNDVDIYGHVNNAVILSYFDLGKVSYFEALDKQGIGHGDMALVIVNVNVDFQAPIFMGDNIVVKTKIYEIGNKSVKLVQELYDEKTQRVKSVCRTIMCGFDPKTNASLPISDGWRRLICAYEKDVLQH